MSSTKILSAACLFALALLTSRVALAQEAKAGHRTTLLVETDPVTFAFSGYAAHVRVSPKGSGWTVGAGVYGMEMPSPVVEFDRRNRGAGFKLDIRNAYGVFVDYHFAGAPRGWFVGLQTALQRWQLGRAGTQEVSEYGTVLAMARVGTLWHPFDAGFYVMPWVGVGGSAKVFGTTSLGVRHYEALPVLAFAAVHLGWAL